MDVTLLGFPAGFVPSTSELPNSVPNDVTVTSIIHTQLPRSNSPEFWLLTCTSFLPQYINPNRYKPCVPSVLSCFYLLVLSGFDSLCSWLSLFWISPSGFVRYSVCLLGFDLSICSLDVSLWISLYGVWLAGFHPWPVPLSLSPCCSASICLWLFGDCCWSWISNCQIKTAWLLAWRPSKCICSWQWRYVFLGLFWTVTICRREKHVFCIPFLNRSTKSCFHNWRLYCWIIYIRLMKKLVMFQCNYTKKLTISL